MTMIEARHDPGWIPVPEKMQGRNSGWYLGTREFVDE
jgi:hypothetical protein